MICIKHDQFIYYIFIVFLAKFQNRIQQKLGKVTVQNMYTYM